MRLPKGHDLPEVVRRPHDQHGHFTVGDSRLPYDPIPVASRRPLVNHDGRPEKERGDREFPRLQTPRQRRERFDHAVVSAGQPAGKFFPDQGQVLIPVIDEGGDYGREEFFVPPGKDPPPQAFGDQ